MKRASHETVKTRSILAIARWYPMPDRTAGDLRFFILLKILARAHHVSLCIDGDLSWQHDLVGADRTGQYRDALTSAGIATFDGGIGAALSSRTYDVVIFEFYFCAEHLIDDVRFRLPKAHIIVDTVDVAYNRLYSKARLTGANEDIEAGRAVKSRELDVYRKADLIVTVTQEDKDLLLAESRDMRIAIIPTIHPVDDLDDAEAKSPNTLIFVGSFLHEPNIDATIYFCNEVLPLIAREEPAIRLRIIGSSPTPAVSALARDGVEVLGYVADLDPHLKSSCVSVAPLRFGGGMKGKIGEAMAHGLPVVTTAIGIEGMGLTPSENVLVGNTPRDFADAVCKLLHDKNLYETIRRNGWKFISDTYSETAVAERVATVMEGLASSPVKRLPPVAYLRREIPRQLHRLVLWRFKTAPQSDR